jgi:hypothetical protein
MHAQVKLVGKPETEIYTLLRGGQKNSRVCPLGGTKTDSFLVSNSELIPTSSLNIPTPAPSIPDAPTQTPTPISAQVDLSQQPPQFDVPGSDKPYFVRKYSNQIEIFEWENLDQAIAETSKWFHESIGTFGAGTFKTDPSTLYELHGFNLNQLETLVEV